MSAAREDLVIVVGDLPPPVHGQAIVTDRVTRVLRQRTQVAVHDIGPQGPGGARRRHARRFVAVLRALVAIGRQRPRAVYMAMAGGRGLALNLLLCLIARSRGTRIFLHHHSFAYIDRRARLMSWLCRVTADRAAHVFLCPRMAYDFCARYPAVRVRIAGNAAFCEDSPRPGPPRQDGWLRVGLLSNLSPEKGLLDFLELLRAAQAENLPLRGILGGPVARARDRKTLIAAKREFGARLDWRGPLDETGKAAFFHEIDVFCFPTRYRHEAQPLVVLEALAHGVPVVAYARGCLASLAHDPALTTVKSDLRFARAAMPILRRFAADGRALAQARQAARHNFEHLSEISQAAWDEVIDAIVASEHTSSSGPDVLECTKSTSA